MVLVDANALLDILTADPVWLEWSHGAMLRAAADGLAINPIIYAELAPAFREERELVAALADWPLQRLPLPYEAAWPAAQAFGVSSWPRRHTEFSVARFLHWSARGSPGTDAPDP